MFRKHIPFNAMAAIVCIVFVFIVVAVNMTQAESYVKMSVSNLIRADGYLTEVHHVTTEDGYILELQRIPFGKNESFPIERRPVAILGHCLLCSSSVYVLLGAEKSLPYMLANNGYDVWMINSRGATGSQRHVYLSTENKKFWQFSWHEMGIYDLSASIDYVLQVTGERQVDYLGLSMGATHFFVLMCERPEYNAKIRKMIALGPAAYLSNFTTPILLRGPATDSFLINKAAQTGKLELPPDEIDVNPIFVSFCSPQNDVMLGKYCDIILRALGAERNENVDLNKLPFFLRYYPDKTSVRAHIHFEQLRYSGKFAKYSYGKTLNKVIYGSTEPPSYNLSRVTVPVSVFWSRTDELTDTEAVGKLNLHLPNLEFSYEIPLQKFSHLDFLWATNAPTVVYNVILERLLPINRNTESSNEL